MKRNKPNSGAETITYYIRDAQGNPMSMYERITAGSTYEYSQTEVPIYGSQRIGMYRPNASIKTSPASGCGPCGSPCGACTSCEIYQWTVNARIINGYYSRDIAKKEYELNDHLGSVHVTLSDRKTSTNAANILNYYNYYSGIGPTMPGKVYEGTDYIFGAQGSEIVKEIGNDRNQITTFYREGDLDAMKWWSIDPKTRADQSPYSMFDNNPVWLNDPDGDCPTCPPSKWELDAVSSGEMGKGLIESFKGTANAVKNLILHPVETAGNLANAIAHPVETVKNIATNISNAFEENPQKASGQLMGDVLQLGLGSAVVAESKAPIQAVNQFAKEKVANVVKNSLNEGKNSITVKTSDEMTRYDLAGKAHGNVSTPHKQSYKWNENPLTGEGKYSRVSKDAVPMSWSDIVKAAKAAKATKQ